MLPLRLVFVLLYGGMMQTMANNQETPLVTLGRPFHLGMLYDMRSEKNDHWYYLMGSRKFG